MTASDSLTPPTITLHKGQQLYRLVKREVGLDGERLYTSLDPNPYRGLDWIDDVRALYSNGEAVAGRFTPFKDEGGEPVPALYLAPLKETAYFEAMLRPVGNMGIVTLEAQYVDQLEVAQMVFNDDLVLADCRSVYLKDGSEPFWDYTENELFNATQLQCIKNARSLAKAIYDKYYPTVDGIVWDSVQQSSIVPCYLLFGPRRSGQIQMSIGALSDYATWKPYLYKAIKEKKVTVSPELAAML